MTPVIESKPEWFGNVKGESENLGRDPSYAAAVDRLAVSLRLKAARHLAGGTNDRGQAVPLPVADLVAREPAKTNGITKSRVEEIEQMRVEARPMELDALAEALGVAPSFLTGDQGDDRATRALAIAELELRALGRELHPGQRTTGEDDDGTGQSPAGAGGAPR